MGARAGRWLAAVLAALALPLLWAPSTRAQGRADPPGRAVTVTTLQGLEFGALRPGIAGRVGIAEAARRGEAVIDGSGNVTVVFTLPAALVSRSGAEIPLSFGPSDGGVLRDASSPPEVFDPRVPAQINLSAKGGIPRILLGGTAAPPRDVPSGEYSATVRIMVVRSGT